MSWGLQPGTTLDLRGTTEESAENLLQAWPRLGPLQMPPRDPRMRPFVFLKTKGVLES